MENKSGLIPVGRAVLIEPLEDTIVAGSQLVIPQEVRRNMLTAEQVGIVIAVGSEAWKDEIVPRAKPGDKVMISKWAGHMTVGKDKKQYRVINSHDVFLRLEA